jgi:ABC-type lipoprotein release transport system permease subunit
MLWGGGGDVVVDFGESSGKDSYDEALQKLATDDRVVDLTGMTEFYPEIGGLSLVGFALDTRRGGPVASVLSGRVPRSPDEIAMGRTTMRRLGLQIGDNVDVVVVGDQVDVVVERDTQSFHLVGQVAFPIGDTSVDQGVAVTAEGARRFPGFAAQNHVYQATLNWASGVDERQATADLTAQGYQVLVDPPRPPVVAHLAQVDRLAGILAIFFGVLGLASVAYLLGISARAGRHQFGVLAALGLAPRRCASILRWQAVTVGTIAALIGIPVGVVIGRSIWALVASHAGVVVSHAIPFGALGVALAVAIGGSLALSLALTDRVRRLRVAEILRTG